MRVVGEHAFVEDDSWEADGWMGLSGMGGFVQ